MIRKGWVLFDYEHKNNLYSLFGGQPFIIKKYQLPIVYMQNFIMPIDLNSWFITHCGKKVKWPLVFKLTQLHTNNWEASKILILVIVFFPLNVHLRGYGWMHNILSGHICYDVTIINYLINCSCIYLVIMLTMFLVRHGTWV
jgi:hypothetical protein